MRESTKKHIVGIKSDGVKTILRRLSIEGLWFSTKDIFSSFVLETILVLQKIVSALCKIKEGKQKKLFLGNLNARRDWGHARDYCFAMWKMMQQKKPDDYVIATGVQYSIKEFVNLTAKKLNLKITWKGKGVLEKGYDKNGKAIIECDKNYLRPLDVNTLLGDAKKARNKLKWKPSIKIETLIN